MSDKVPTKTEGGNTLTMGFFGICGLGLASLLLIRTGYEMGINQSRKILHRHDKDYRRMEKREKKIYKAHLKHEKEKREAGP